MMGYIYYYFFNQIFSFIDRGLEPGAIPQGAHPHALLKTSSLMAEGSRLSKRFILVHAKCKKTQGLYERKFKKSSRSSVLCFSLGLLITFKEKEICFMFSPSSSFL